MNQKSAASALPEKAKKHRHVPAERQAPFSHPDVSDHEMMVASPYTHDKRMSIKRFMNINKPHKFQKQKKKSQRK